jgi:hypothetical protein
VTTRKSCSGFATLYCFQAPQKRPREIGIVASFHIPPSALIAVKLLLLISDSLAISAILVIRQFAFIRGQFLAFLRVSVPPW